MKKLGFQPQKSGRAKNRLCPQGLKSGRPFTEALSMIASVNALANDLPVNFTVFTRRRKFHGSV